MARAVKRNTAEWTYVLVSDRELPETEQSRFVLRPMNTMSRAEMHDSLTRTVYRRDGGVEVATRIRQQSVAALLGHIVRVENFPSDGPRPWPEDSSARLQYLELLDDAALDELGNELWAKSGPAVPDRAPSPPEA